MNLPVFHCLPNKAVLLICGYDWVSPNTRYLLQIGLIVGAGTRALSDALKENNKNIASTKGIL